MERKDLFALDGFDENMLLGWHVDLNIAKRLRFIHRTEGDLTAECFGYHCDHTRRATPMHQSTSPMNDFSAFVDNVRTADLAGQREAWGCAGDDIEEISLMRPASRAYVGALETAIGEPLKAPLEAGYEFTRYWDRIDYEPRHVLPFLVDLMVCAPRSLRISYFGGHRAMFDLLCAALRRIGFENPVLVANEDAARLGLTPENAGVAAPDEVFAADIFIFDCVTIEGKAASNEMGPADAALVADLVRSFERLVDDERERARARSGPPRRVVMINAIENRFGELVRKYLDYARTPFSTRLRHGFIRLNDRRGLLRARKERRERRDLRKWMISTAPRKG